MTKVGILGGSFDPPHTGHTALANAALSQFDLDRVLLMTSGNPPHKNGAVMTSAQLRHKMTELAVMGHSGLSAFDFEVEKGEKCYTANTLAELLAINPDWEIYFIIGEDSLCDLPSWYHPELVAQRCVLLVYPRGEGDINALIEKRALEYNADIRLIDAPEFNVSSTEIRERIRCGESTDGLLDARVLQFIKDKGLYV